MVITELVDYIAYELFQAEAEGKEVDKFTELYPELDLGLAYEIQKRLVELKVEKHQTRRSGYKLGLTSKAKQEMMGVHEPTYGVLLEDMQLMEGQEVSIAPFIHAKIEPEIAFIFNKEVSGPSINTADILDATAYIAPAMEVIDSRYRNFNFTLADVVADNSSSSRYIMSEKLYRLEDIDLRLMGMVFKKNSQIESTSTGAAVMGHPARAIAWMANELSRSGQSIKPGDVVLSGALAGAVEIHAGDHFSVQFDGIGSLDISFKE
ncbi:2-keto-4-pentenoate hydratase [Bacillus thermotolerans]|uniref:4-oxalocrotonate decarboxylase n=1 Tax=Bacillus thermotolerans TaxID=1221996 RepID=A0A0F5I2V9_BACTR|nr:fumarylacetoacetate hydrolase family protein [Bacillus thermotolerans]KKB36932.1 4-oxalocrotonate decarboxylase [Bacillus thermotolerans]KKB39585.1 4-oxalocrotonate decarboxylase [Bacillus thermotolerans]